MSESVRVSDAQREKILFQALRIRMVEEKIIDLYPTDVIQSPVHLSIGQELHNVALATLLQGGDRIFTTYRSHAPYLANGGDLKLMMAELYGKLGGISKGKAGSMHLCSPDTGLMGSSAIVGAVYSHAMGAAYADKIKKNNRVVLCITGEGATEEGTFHECLNFTSLKQLPIVYIIENNGLAINIPVKQIQSYKLRDLVSAYGINHFHIKDGFEIDVVLQLAGDAITAAREKHIPAVIEIETYRYKEHVGISCDHDKNYRDKEEYDHWRNRDPLIQNSSLLATYQAVIAAEIEEAVCFAENSPFPSQDELLKDVY